MKNEKTLKIIPIGGSGEVGKNMIAYQYDDNILIVDAGMMFPENDMLGIDYIIPDMNYLLERRQQIKGIVITHGHEDHIGAIHHVIEEFNVPIYTTRLTRGLLEVKLARLNLVDLTDLHTVQAGDHINIGPFEVEFFHVCHSIPDSVGLGIQTPEGLVVHTGDFKFDQTPVDNWPTDFNKLVEFSNKGVLALLSDSTNSITPGWTASERMIDKALNDLLNKAKGRVIIASFASLISRMQQVVNAAIKHDRKLAFAGTSMVENAKMAVKLGYLELPESSHVSIESALKLPPSKVLIMCTGSQGEPTSILGRLSTGRFRLFDIQKGDTVVLSSHTIPGNEESVSGTINRLFQRGADVIYESVAPVHVSGHASEEELKLLLNLVKPKYVIPIHGELRHLHQLSHIAQNVGVPKENIAVVENGHIIEFSKGKMTIGERIPGSYIFVDGLGVGDIGPGVIRERESLSRAGIVIINVSIDKASGTPLFSPNISSYGFISVKESEILMDRLKQVVLDAIKNNRDDQEKKIRKAVISFLHDETHRRPMVFVTINNI